MKPDPEAVLRELARLIAPYVAEELQRPRPSVAASYDQNTCTVFVSELGTHVLERAYGFFRQLELNGRISSVELAGLVTDKGPRAIGGVLTSPIKRRARHLGLPLPFLGGEGVRPYGGIPDPLPGDDPHRTYWVDHDGIAGRMVKAIIVELDRRPEAIRPWRFTWEPGDFEILGPNEAAEILDSPDFHGPVVGDEQPEEEA
jgi:hypothetical protein